MTVKTIGKMLSYRRAHNSNGERLFINRYIKPLQPDVISDGVDVAAYIVRIPRSDGMLPPTAFCAHVDTVHDKRDTQTRQRIMHDTVRNELFLPDTKEWTCLGADDAAGCYIMINMIKAGVAGTYIFFRGEEVGGLGSRYVATQRPDLLDGIKHAIQFDRRGTQSIITTMARGRTCSDTFGLALADALGMGHVLDPTGSFTDTANLADIVPECTNVSCGYDSEHSAKETLDVTYLMELSDACIRTFKDETLSLPVARDPSAVEFDDQFDDMIGGISIYDLPYMTRREVREFVEMASVNELTDLLYMVGSMIGVEVEGFGDAAFARAEGYWDDNDPSHTSDLGDGSWDS